MAHLRHYKASTELPGTCVSLTRVIAVLNSYNDFWSKDKNPFQEQSSLPSAPRTNAKQHFITGSGILHSFISALDPQVPDDMMMGRCPDKGVGSLDISTASGRNVMWGKDSGSLSGALIPPPHGFSLSCGLQCSLASPLLQKMVPMRSRSVAWVTGIPSTDYDLPQNWNIKTSHSKLAKSVYPLNPVKQ